tara:strand:- start:301 stop:546 length:246 start_codon:yes stop_codon:yes gene_type:complete
MKSISFSGAFAVREERHFDFEMTHAEIAELLHLSVSDVAAMSDAEVRAACEETSQFRDLAFERSEGYEIEYDLIVDEDGEE